MIDDETISAYNNQVEAYADLTRQPRRTPILWLLLPR